MAQGLLGNVRCPFMQSVSYRCSASTTPTEFSRSQTMATAPGPAQTEAADVFKPANELSALFSPNSLAEKGSYFLAQSIST